MQDRLRKLMEGSSFAMCNQQVQEIKIGIKGLGAAGGERGQINQFLGQNARGSHWHT